jgi:hypothetical protein
MQVLLIGEGELSSGNKATVLLAAARVSNPIKLSALHDEDSILVEVVACNPKVPANTGVTVLHYKPALNLEIVGASALKLGLAVNWPISGMIFSSLDGSSPDALARTWGESVAPQTHGRQCMYAHKACLLRNQSRHQRPCMTKAAKMPSSRRPWVAVRAPHLQGAS